MKIWLKVSWNWWPYWNWEKGKWWKEKNFDEKDKKIESKNRFKDINSRGIKPNQVILVQVIKDEGQRCSVKYFYLYCRKVYCINANTPKGGGISRKIFNPADRKKIRSILNEIEIPREMGLIVRTAGATKPKMKLIMI